jgi:hypothetical protein
MEQLEVRGQTVRRVHRVAPGGENQVIVADTACGGQKHLTGEVHAGHYGLQEAAAALAEGRDGGVDAIRVDASDGDLVDKGYKRVLLRAVDQQGGARAAQRGGETPDQGRPGKPRPDYHDSCTARGVLGTSHLYTGSRWSDGLGFGDTSMGRASVRRPWGLR